MVTRLALLAALSSIGMLAGCGDSGPRTYPVTGTVTLDGTPLKDGDIVLAPTDRQRAPTRGQIKDGKFSMRCVDGSMRTEIWANREVPGVKDPRDRGPIVSNYIPARYNIKSTLTADVAANGMNTFDFELKSDPN